MSFLADDGFGIICFFSYKKVMRDQNNA